MKRVLKISVDVGDADLARDYCGDCPHLSQERGLENAFCTLYDEGAATGLRCVQCLDAEVPPCGCVSEPGCKHDGYHCQCTPCVEHMSLADAVTIAKNWQARAEFAERELSEAFGLPPTIGPVRGEAKRIVDELRGLVAKQFETQGVARLKELGTAVIDAARKNMAACEQHREYLNTPVPTGESLDEYSRRHICELAYRAEIYRTHFRLRDALNALDGTYEVKP